jgi:hypothetical protein
MKQELIIGHSIYDNHVFGSHSKVEQEESKDELLLMDFDANQLDKSIYAPYRFDRTEILEKIE